MNQKFKDVQKFEDANFIKWAERPAWDDYLDVLRTGDNNVTALRQDSA